ncbi:DUF4097 family beta strand repeat-containing protein [candidate division KSB1 bacterium]
MRLSLALILMYLTFSSCASEIVRPEIYTVEMYDTISFHVRNLTILDIENVSGDIFITNTDTDSVRIKLTKYSSSQASEEKASSYLPYISYGIDTIASNHLKFYSDAQRLNYDMLARIDWEIEVPDYVDIITNISSGNQDISVKVPRDNDGFIMVNSVSGEIYLTIPKLSSTAVAAETIDGFILYENLDFTALEQFDTGEGERLIGILGNGKGAVTVNVTTGNIYIVGRH